MNRGQQSSSALSQGVLRLNQRSQDEAETLLEAIRGSPSLNIDETGWRTSGVNDYLWVFTDEFHTAYQIIHSRASQVVKDALGEEYQGMINFDFFSAYNPLPYRKQKCHSHLGREFQAVSERNDSAEFRWLKGKVDRLRGDSVRLKADRDKYPYEVFQRRLLRLVQRALEFGDMEFTGPDSTRLAGRMVKYAEELFTFIDHLEVEATINLAERIIRPNVVIRKTSGGNRSRKGAQAQETLMSLVVTSQQKRIDWFEYGKTVLKNFRDNVKEPLIAKA